MAWRAGMRSSRVAQEILPIRQARIGDRLDQHPLILEGQRQQRVDELRRAAGIGAEDAGEKADIDARGLRIFHDLEIAQRPIGRRHLSGIGAIEIAVDPAEHIVGAGETGLGPGFAQAGASPTSKAKVNAMR